MEQTQNAAIRQKMEGIVALEASLSGQAALLISHVTTVKMALQEMKKILENSDVLVVPKGTPESVYMPPPQALPAVIYEPAVDSAPVATVKSSDAKNGKANAGKSLKVQVSKPKKHACDSCDFKTDYPESLERHKKIHAKQKMLGFEISKGKHCVSSDTVDFVASVNDESNPFQCPHCSTRFPKKTTLNSHLLNKHNSKAKSHKCEKCNTMFSSQIALRDHAAIHDSKVKALKCDKCDFSTAYQGNLLAHSAMIHGLSEHGDKDAMIIG